MSQPEEPYTAIKTPFEPGDVADHHDGKRSWRTKVVRLDHRLERALVVLPFWPHTRWVAITSLRFVRRSTKERMPDRKPRDDREQTGAD